jgi:hypothetical protein
MGLTRYCPPESVPFAWPQAPTCGMRETGHTAGQHKKTVAKKDSCLRNLNMNVLHF